MSEILDRVKKRIKQSRRRYCRSAQIAELLLRNEEFTETALDSRLDSFPEWKRPCGENRINFLIRWGVQTDWDGSAGSLARCIQTKPEIFFRRWLTQETIGVLSYGLKPNELSTKTAKAWAENVRNEGEYIYLRIRSTTKKKDVEDLWPIIEKIKKEVYGFLDREKQTFGRDLCWYDLNRKEEFGKLSLGKIRYLWNYFFPQKPPVSRIIIQKGIERIKNFSFRLAPLMD